MSAIITDTLNVANADEAASIVLNQAMQASAQGTFAVGGAIIENATGRVIQVMHNNVLKLLNNPFTNPDTNLLVKNFTYDPTAHGERQLVYWYYENKDQLSLPEPSELTIVTTLDPCAMCAGALLAAGFNVGVVAIDVFAGINYDEKFVFNDLPSKLRPLAQSKFGYYACGSQDDPDRYKRSYTGSFNVAFKDTVVSGQRLMGCDAVFQASVNDVRGSSSNSGLDPDKLLNPANLPDDSPIKQKYQKIYSDAFKVAVPSRLPNMQLLNILQTTKNAKPGAKNAVAFLDSFGNVVLCLADSFECSPVHTAFMSVTREYAMTRFELIDDKTTQKDAIKHLSHPKYGTFVFLYAPNPSEATTIMTLGAYGSTMEGSVPQVFPANFQYYYPPQDGSSIQELRSVIMGLPPFYRNANGLQISAMEVGDISSEGMPIPIYMYQAENPDRYYYTNIPNDSPGQEWSKTGIAFFAFQSGTAGAVPTYQFSANSPQRYGFGTNSLPASGWTNGNKETFYVLTSASSNSVPIYQYHQILPGGYWNMFYSLDSNVEGLINDGMAFHVFGG